MKITTTKPSAPRALLFSGRSAGVEPLFMTKYTRGSHMTFRKPGIPPTLPGAKGYQESQDNKRKGARSVLPYLIVGYIAVLAIIGYFLI